MEHIFRRESVRVRIFGNPLGPVLQQYIAYLSARGHKPSSVHQYVFALEHFGNWLGTGAISHESVDEFVMDHIPRCRCKKPASCTIHCIRAALNRLLEMHGLSRPDPVVPASVARPGRARRSWQVLGYRGATTPRSRSRRLFRCRSFGTTPRSGRRAAGGRAGCREAGALPGAFSARS